MAVLGWCARSPAPGKCRIRHTVSVASAVIFDFYGTLARWRDSHLSNYTSVFAAHGYELPDEVLLEYFARYDGVEHSVHSTSQTAYEAWVRHRLCDLTRACGVTPADQNVVMDALRASDTGLMVAYPEATSTLTELRRHGLVIGVCSNWGWELDAFLRQVELLHLVDVALTSARVGARKPHPLMYQTSAAALGVHPNDVVFVGDSWIPDVEGPQRAGMAPVHVWRAAERRGQAQPPLVAGVHRIGDLSELTSVLGLKEWQ